MAAALLLAMLRVRPTPFCVMDEIDAPLDSMNTGRFATAVGVGITGALFTMLGGSYAMVGAFGAIIYALGAIAIWFAPDTSGT